MSSLKVNGQTSEPRLIAVR